MIEIIIEAVSNAFVVILGLICTAMLVAAAIISLVGVAGIMISISVGAGMLYGLEWSLSYFGVNTGVGK